MLYVPIVIYMPALAFNQGKQNYFHSNRYQNCRIFLVTGINLHYITPVVSIVCIFYTTLVSINETKNIQNIARSD